MSRKFEQFIYFLPFLAFILLYSILAFNNRLAADDFYFLKNLNELGWWDSMVLSWHSWVTRWASILFLNIVLYSYKITGSFLLYHFFTLGALYISFIRLWPLAAGCWQLKQGASSKEHAALLLITFFFLSASVGETFFWITSTAMYLWGFIALNFGVAELLKAKNNVVSSIACAILFLFVGGSAEAISIPALLIIAGIFFSRVKNKKSISLCLFSFSVLLFSIWVGYKGEGRILRQAALPETTLTSAIVISAKSIVKMTLLLLKEKLPWLILFFVAWAGIGKTFTVSSSRIEAPRLIKWGFLLLLIILVLFIPSIYLLGETPPYRAWILITFSLCLFTSIAGIYVGQILKDKKVLSKPVVVSSWLLITFLIAKESVEQFKITSAYAEEVDARMEQLRLYPGSKSEDVVQLVKLPDSGLLISAEFGDSTGIKNNHVLNYFNIKSSVIKIK